MALKQGGVHFLLCPKQGNKIEGVVLNSVCILGFFFCLKQGQGFKPSAANLIPKYWLKICMGLKNTRGGQPYDLHSWVYWFLLLPCVRAHKFLSLLFDFQQLYYVQQRLQNCSYFFLFALIIFNLQHDPSGPPKCSPKSKSGAVRFSNFNTSVNSVCDCFANAEI